MTTSNDNTRAECIRLQAERVVRAYNAMREAARAAMAASPDFDFPAAEMGEFFKETRLLEHWLEPTTDDTEHAVQDESADARPEITVLVGNHCDAIYGIHGLARALVALDEPESLELAIALRELSKRLYGGLGSLVADVENKIEAAVGMKVRS